MNNSSLPEILDRADREYAARGANQNLRPSIEHLRRVLAESKSYGAGWRLSRALFFLGQETEAAARLAAGKDRGSRPAARDLHLAGARAGRRARRWQSERVEGHFWTGVNLALLAALEPGFKAAIHARQANRALQLAVEIDAAYHAAGPLRVLARLQHKLPRWLGGDKRQARENFERAIGLAPGNTVTRIYFAQLLLELGETPRARTELESVVSAAFDPDWEFEIKRDQRLAEAMLAGL